MHVRKELLQGAVKPEMERTERKSVTSPTHSDEEIDTNILAFLKKNGEMSTEAIVRSVPGRNTRVKTRLERMVTRTGQVLLVPGARGKYYKLPPEKQLPLPATQAAPHDPLFGEVRQPPTHLDARKHYQEQVGAAMIEESLDHLEDRVTALEKRFDQLVNLLLAGFGDSTAQNIQFLESTIAAHEKQIETMRGASAETNALLVDLARILGVRGNITGDALKKAAKKRVAK